MINITDKKKCCGCAACIQRCPKHCITMHIDKDVFWYPVVDMSVCVNCHLCEKKVDLDLSPTLLIYQNDYVSLIQNVPKNKNTLFTYILDPTFDKSQGVNKISKELNLGINEFNTRAENGMGVELKLRVAPPVETWISGFRDADFIVTDSFHGMVFSIIFNKPFVVYINPNRGTERFTSLLSMLGLLDRMITCSTGLNQSLLSDTIVWNKVNDVINIKRKEIMSKLSRYLVSHIFNNQ